MELTVRHAWKREVDIPDLVRTHSSHRGRIENETVCKVTVQSNNRRISHYVVVKGLGTGFCDLGPNRLLGNCLYFIRHPDRYVKLLAWLAAISFVISIVVYTFKDWLAALFSTPTP